MEAADSILPPLDSRLCEIMYLSILEMAASDPDLPLSKVKSAGFAAPSVEAPEASGARNTWKKQAARLVKELPHPSLNALPGNESRISSPMGEDTQGPLPIDYTLEIVVVFPLDMVLDMQKCAAQRARKTVIGRTLGGRASYKDLVDCLKLHLPAPFVTITLLTRGYFEILFEEEEGARATRKLAAVEWSSIGEVLDIESPDSYIKRLAGPMVIVKVRDISKLAGIIRMPSMSEGADTRETTAQRILYSGLSNQCRKCRRFGHLARACPHSKLPTQEGNTSAKPPPKGSWKSAPKKTPGAQRWRQTMANSAEEQQD
ncbi:unnamed protein product [Sphagnum troendelagicum]|uniref:CCHC-type domain-containing protein n=1 Tax=Sphagnum troendelagicum TaxID=128251 RepID=A0ABP0U8B5_9BRYO